MKVFISGPITGVPNYKAYFKKAEDLIRNAGHIPVNPVPIGEELTIPENATADEEYAIFMKADIKALLECDAVYQLSGWANSKGASFEAKVASICNMPTIREI